MISYASTNAARVRHPTGNERSSGNRCPCLPGELFGILHGMKAKGTFRVMVALVLASAAGRKKLNGSHRFLSEGYDWDMELVRDESDFTADVLSAASRSHFDGMLVGFIERHEFKRIHASIGIPTVFIDYPDAEILGRMPLCMFINDSAKAIAQSAARHLLSCPGVRSFGFVPSRTPFRWSSDRQSAFAAALRQSKRRLSVYDGPGDSREALGEWLLKLEKPAAVLAAFDDRARDVLEACRANAIGVPDQVSVLGIGNDEPICEMSTPALSSIAIDFEEEGYRAARELQAMMLRGRTPAIRERPCGVKEVVFRASTTASRTPAALVQRALAFIDQHALEGISTSDVVKNLHVSRSLADLRFREVTGSSILEAILVRRLDATKRLLRETDLHISEIALRCGYRDANYLKNLFKKRVGMSMREFRRRSKEIAHDRPD